MIKVYGFKGRSRAERVIWALDELSLDYQLIRLDYSSGDHRSDEFLRLNPLGKVPVLVHDNMVLTESVAIVHYLDKLLPEPVLVPVERDTKYRYEQRLQFACSEIENFLWLADQALFLNDVYQWPAGTAERAAAIAEQHIRLAEDWLVDAAFMLAGRFTALDIIYYHILSWSALHSIQLRESTEDYLARMASRPAFPATMANPGSPARTG